MDQFRAIGISYKAAPLEIREAVTFDDSSSRTFIRQCRDVLGVSEILVLSTCNRTEIYYAAEKDLRDELISFVAACKGISSGEIAPFFSYYDAKEAINHLFEVSLGLDSMVLGDIQITNQVKRAYQCSADEGLAGPFLHRLLHTIFFTNKRVVQETSFRDGTASLASVAVELTKHFTLNFTSPRVAIIGLGEIGSDVAENLKGFEGEILLVNRTKDKAIKLAEDLGYSVGDFADLRAIIHRVDVVISAVSGPEPIITRQLFEEGQFYHKMLIDLSVPRSIDHSLEALNGLLLYNVDQLTEKTRDALKKRSAAIPEVKAIVNASIGEFGQWSQEMEVSPVIQKLKNALEDIRQQELARYVGKLDETQSRILDKATKNIIQKVIKLPVLQLKAACKRGEAETLVEVLNDLFNLEKNQKASL